MRLFKFVSESKFNAQYLLDHFNLNDYNAIRLGNAVIVELSEQDSSKQNLESFCYIGNCFVDHVTEYDYNCFVVKFGDQIMLVVNKLVYDWFVSSKFPKLGDYQPTKEKVIHKIVNLNGGIKPCDTPLIFLKTNQCYKIGLEKYLEAYYNQDESRFVSLGDSRRILAGRLLRKYRKNKLK